ncbi:chemotaxis protein CheW, partial [Patescibacteria group bacterium]|nr:chemotaxis protein CheW [Patescibacteria group bacterium]
LVRDLAKKEHKKIKLDILGSEMELDRTVLDKLVEPLIHLVRNAVDHGIEKEGKIKIIAMRDRENTLVVVEDNGKGIDPDKIKQALVEKEIMSSKEVSVLSRQQIMDMIFDPRLSTKKKITEVSGRGVGMSIVKKFAEQVGGRVIVDSPLKEGGTRVTLELPLTLAVINALLVKVSSSTFAIPFSSIERTVRVKKEEIKSAADYDVAIVADEELPLIWTENIFSLGEELEKDRKINTYNVVIVKKGQEKAGVVIDQVIDEQEIIVKPLASVFKKLKSFSGSTILGDGKAALILDVPGILESPERLLREN